MRVWDISVKKLCRSHLLGEHRELHAIWSILVQKKKGYAHHPETLRWKGKLRALYQRHKELVKEMIGRGYRHYSPLDARFASGAKQQRQFVDLPCAQVVILRRKKCGCKV
ncbi:MAG: pyrimidine dimer DNA glycosylase/endonuclease V [Candidatus Omnitrophota bacterium]